MAEKILMGEYKALSKERWTNIEVSYDRHEAPRHTDNTSHT